MLYLFFPGIRARAQVAMKHIEYVMTGVDPAPAGDGDTKTWFEYYKWNSDGETYVPVKFPFKAAEAGDFLWFVMDGKILGGATILRVETPPLPVQRQEIWFDSSTIRVFPLGATPSALTFNTLGDDLLALTVPRSES